MRVNDIEITKKDIQFAEKILLPNGATFNDEKEERKNFIKKVSTLDLHAVPGSGKTTSLLAKLLVLERKLPFKDGSGILVLSHTNTAVDEIKDRVGKYCPKLFSYPSFIGTIQSFVNEFLAKPYYNKCFKRKIIRVDDEIYNEKIENYYNYRSIKYNGWIKRKHAPLNFLQQIRFDDNLRLILGIDSTFESFPLSQESKTYKSLFKMKKHILETGIINFDDAYFLANRYLIKFPKIKETLQSRFTYVFVDEMQDMDNHQYKILEDIFYDNGESKSIYQRVGDRNQAIYNGDVKLDSIWEPRDIELKITGSHRLSKNIANIVQFFGLSSREINGLNKNDDGSEIKIPPHLIVYDDETCKCKVIQKFIEIIKKYQEDGGIPSKLKDPIKAISWIAKDNEEHKISLPNYCPKFEKTEVKPKADYDSLESYLIYYDKDIKILKEIRKNILNALIKILRIEGIKNKEDRYYSRRRLLKYLENENVEAYENLKLKLYKWSISIIRCQKDKVISDIQEYIKDFLNIFDKDISKSYDFINAEVKQRQETNIELVDDPDCELCKINGEKIKLDTVHSVKGETHTATLYVESFYNKKYESDILKDIIKGEKQFVEKIQEITQEIIRLKNEILELNGKSGTKKIKNEVKRKYNEINRLKRYSKMVYVGFSRPTHLLAFAVHRDRYDKYLKGIQDNKWKTVKL